MIEKGRIEAHLEDILRDNGMFLVDVSVGSTNKILVHVDRNEGVSIDDCVLISKALEEKLDRDLEDFALEVSSPGLDAPFKVPQQYEKNIGRMVSVKLTDGRKILGVLFRANPDHIMLEMDSGNKGADPVKERVELSEIRSVSLHFQI